MYTLKINFKSIKKIDNLKNKILKLKKINNLKNIKIKGCYNIKHKNKIFTVLKSPHVNKKSREHFLYKNFNQKIEIIFINIFQLLNFITIIKKSLNKNLIIKTKIIKK